MASINLYSSSSSSLLALSRSQCYNGLQTVLPVTANCNASDFIFFNIGKRLCLRFKANGGVRAAKMSGEGSYPSSNMELAKSIFINEQADQPTVNERQPDAIAFGTLAAEITPTISRGFPEDDEFELDRPTEGFSSIPDAIDDIRQGKTENEGDLIMAASFVTTEAMAFIVKHGTGIVCVSMKADDLERLQLTLMVSQNENDEKLSTAFTTSSRFAH